MPIMNMAMERPAIAPLERPLDEDLGQSVDLAPVHVEGTGGGGGGV